MTKTICFSLFKSELYKGRFWEYLIGALANIQARDRHFPEFELEFYVEESLHRHAVVQFLLLQPGVSVIWRKSEPFRDGVQWRFERLRAAPLDNADVVLIRDIDSVLTATDAVLVNKWLEEKEKPPAFLIYREHQMCLHSAGGGFGVNYAGLPPQTVLLPKETNKKAEKGWFHGRSGFTGLVEWGENVRGIDERVLHEAISAHIDFRSVEYEMRMCTRGRYFILNEAHSSPPSEIEPLLHAAEFFTLEDKLRPWVCHSLYFPQDFYWPTWNELKKKQDKTEAKWFR